jgi:hypothetical protein
VTCPWKARFRRGYPAHRAHGHFFFCTWPQSYLPRTTLSLTPGRSWVALAGDEAHGLAARAEAHAAALAVGRVGLLGLAGERAQNHALQLRPPFGGAGPRKWPLGGPQTVHLVQGSHGASGAELGNQGQAWRDTWEGRKGLLPWRTVNSISYLVLVFQGASVNV